MTKKAIKNHRKVPQKVPFFTLWPELRFLNLISGPHSRPSFQALISGPHFRPAAGALCSGLTCSGPTCWPEMRAWNEGLKWGFRTSIQAKGWKWHFLGTFRWVLITFFVISELLRLPYTCKIPILQKNQSNSFIFDVGALFQKFLTL